jgi:hypothetical protein
LAWTPVTVLQSGVTLNKVTWNTDLATTAPAMSAGTWTLDTANKILYVWATDGAAPAGRIEASRRIAVWGNACDWIAVDGLTFYGSNDAGLDTDGGDSWLVTNCTAHHNAYYGIKASGGSVDCVFGAGNEAYKNGLADTVGNAHGGIGANVATNLTIQHCKSHDNNDSADTDGFQINSVTGLLFEHNEAYNNHNLTGTSADNLQVNSTTSAVVRYNYLHGACNSNIIFTGTNASGDVYYNLIDGEGVALNGINCNGTSQTSPIRVYNNTIHSVTQRPLHIAVTGTSTITMKNNNAHGTTYALVVEAGVDASKITLDYNDYTNDSGNLITWNGTAYATLTAFRAAVAQDAHSISVDPRFTSIVGKNFRLLASSPCIKAGVGVGLTIDHDGQPVPAIPDIGAYQYPQLNRVVQCVGMPTFQMGL